MKLLSYSHAGKESWGAVAGDGVINLAKATKYPTLLNFIASPDYARYQYDLVKKAPAVQLSWDQAYPQTAATSIYQAVQRFVNGGLDTDGFIKEMQALPTS